MADREEVAQAEPATQAERASHFLSLHRPGTTLLMPNAWDVGSAVLLASLGFEGLATTSGGFAASRGRLDGSMRRDEVLEHARELAAATALPLSADLENCFAHDPEGVAATARDAIDTGVAGFSVEDFSGNAEDPIYRLELAAERVRTACEVAHTGGRHIVVTARAENYLHGCPDLADTIARLGAYQAAGADVVFTPRVDDPNVRELAQLGVSRGSVGGAFAVAAYGALVDAATELRDAGTYR